MMHDEDKLQVACVTWFNLQYPGIARLLHHSPNGGQRNKVTGARFKAMGVRAGFPDLILLLARPPFNYLAIELKTPKGRQTDSQKDFERLMSEHGGKYMVIRTFDDFRKAVDEYISPRKLFN